MPSWPRGRSWRPSGPPWPPGWLWTSLWRAGPPPVCWCSLEPSPPPGPLRRRRGRSRRPASLRSSGRPAPGGSCGTACWCATRAPRRRCWRPCGTSAGPASLWRAGRAPPGRTMFVWPGSRSRPPGSSNMLGMPWPPWGTGWTTCAGRRTGPPWTSAERRAGSSSGTRSRPSCSRAGCLRSSGERSRMPWSGIPAPTSWRTRRRRSTPRCRCS